MAEGNIKTTNFTYENAWPIDTCFCGFSSLEVDAGLAELLQHIGTLVDCKVDCKFAKERSLSSENYQCFSMLYHLLFHFLSLSYMVYSC